MARRRLQNHTGGRMPPPGARWKNQPEHLPWVYLFTPSNPPSPWFAIATHSQPAVM
jgi:hypothetical protein